MANRRKKEVRKAPLVCYTTETYKTAVSRYVEIHHPGVTVSTFLLQLVQKAVPAEQPQDVALQHA